MAEISVRILTPVQLLARYTDPESHNARRYRQRDAQMDRTDGRHDMMPVADYTVYQYDRLKMQCIGLRLHTMKAL